MEKALGVVKAAKPEYRDAVEAVAFLVNAWIQAEHGYKCVGHSEEGKAWNASRDCYVFAYDTDETKIKIVRMGSNLIVCASASLSRSAEVKLEAKDFVASGAFEDDWVMEGETDYASLYRGLTQLGETLKEKLKPAFSTSRSTSTPTTSTGPSEGKKEQREGSSEQSGGSSDPLRVRQPPKRQDNDPRIRPMRDEPIRGGRNPRGPGRPGDFDRDLNPFPNTTIDPLRGFPAGQGGGGGGNLYGPDRFGPDRMRNPRGSGGRGGRGGPRRPPKGIRYDPFGPVPGMGNPNNDDFPPPGPSSGFL